MMEIILAACHSSVQTDTDSCLAAGLASVGIDVHLVGVCWKQFFTITGKSSKEGMRLAHDIRWDSAHARLMHPVFIDLESMATGMSPHCQIWHL